MARRGPGGGGGGGGGGDAGDGGGGDASLALPESRFLQSVSRAEGEEVVGGSIALKGAGSGILKAKKHVPASVLGGPSVAPIKHGGQDELGLIFPSSGPPARRAKPLSSAEIEDVLVHVVSLQESANDAEEEARVQRLLAGACGGPGIVLLPSAGAYLRQMRMATKNAELTRRLVVGRGELLRARLSLDQADAEKLLRRMLTKIDDDTRRMSEDLRELGGVGPAAAHAYSPNDDF